MCANKESADYLPASEKYRLIERISAVNLNQIWHGKKIKDDKDLTIKQTKFFVKDSLVPPSVFQELVILSEISYPHIIRPYFNELSIDFNNQLITYCFENNLTNIQRIIRYFKKKNEVMPFVAAKSIIFQLLLAIDYLHSRKIAHCNIIPSNLVLVSENDRIPGILKLMDFGYARVIENSSNPKSLNVVHPWYRAPELLLGDSTYDNSIDIWACGCVFAELLTGNVLFGSKKKEPPSELNSTSQLLRISSILGPINETDCANPQHCQNLQQFLQNQPMNSKNILSTTVNTAPEAFDLLSKMLEYNSSKRISSRDALNHSFFCKEPLCETNIVGLFSKKDWSSLIRQQQKQQQQAATSTRSQPQTNQT